LVATSDWAIAFLLTTIQEMTWLLHKRFKI